MANDKSFHSSPTDSPFAWLDGGGEMGTLIRALDWRQTPIGAVESWSPALRMMVRFLLANRFPLLLWWGPEYVSIYNDPYRPVLGSKHPWALGLPVSQCWSEIWHVLRPLIDTPFQGGPATWNEDIELEINRHGFVEETHFTIAYSPVPDDTVASGIGGVLATVHEITDKVVGERRVVALRDLGARIGNARTVDEACEIAARTLSVHEKDVPFVLLYLADADGGHARLAAASGVDAGSDVAPRRIERSAARHTAWPLASVGASEAPLVVTPLSERFRSIPKGPWSEPPGTALVMSIPSPAADQAVGWLITGVSARLNLDAYYRDFLGLVRTQIAAAIGRARAYEEERLRAETLAELDRAKTTFFSNVSHEFRTPLTLLVGPLEDSLADTVTPLPPVHREREEIAHRNALRLLRLVNSLLDFSRIEAGRIDASYEPTDLALVTTELASVFRSAVEKAGLELVVDCPPLPAPVYVDRDMWEKIVLNLLSNAFKFTFDGRITVSLRTQSDEVVLQVADTGVGIPAADLPRMFERFHRVRHTRARTHEGTGIGLALVQELARLHGGTVTVASKEGHGTTFSVHVRTGTSHLSSDRISVPRRLRPTSVGTMPFVEEALRWLPLSETDSFPAPTITSDGAPMEGPPRVLVVDDNADMRDYLRRMLEPSYRVETIGDGGAALERMSRETPDLVLTDVMMPTLDGFGLLAAVRANERTRSVPVILVSARAGEEARIEGLQAGADEYLVKPFSARELLACVGSQLQLARLRLERIRLLEETAAITEALNRVGALVSSDLDRSRVVQAVTDAGTELTTAEFGAFFHNVVETGGESYTLYTISGAARETFSTFPMPRDASVFEPTFKGTAAVRSHDITKDPRYGQNPPYQSMAPGHLPVRSYLAVPVKGPTGDVIGGLFFGHSAAGRFTDQHERLAIGIASWASVALENARLYASVQDASRIKDDFLASLSHELRTPLNAILGYARMLQSGVITPERRQKAVDTIERNATSLTQIVEDVLDISRIVSGKIRLNVQAVDFPDVVRRAIDAIMPAAEARGIRVEVALDPQASPVSGDPERLQQVLWNLLTNAVKFTPRSGRVQVQLARVDSHIEVVVSDTGIGITREFLPYVFERFRQADGGITRERGGLGLGLSIARQLIEMHGGSIVASSDGLNRGATFRITIPIMAVNQVQDAARHSPPEPAAATSPISTGDLSGIRVLAVDDEKDALSLVAEVLEIAGAQVVTASSAAAALELLITERPDVIVADLGMPQMDGFQFIEHVRRHANPATREIPAAALTAYARSDDRMKALRAGFHIHLAKPIDPAELVTTMAALARRFTRGDDSPQATV
jgi:signal transduction histidine kinase/DNA-binding response OmpR family regulator